MIEGLEIAVGFEATGWNVPFLAGSAMKNHFLRLKLSRITWNRSLTDFVEGTRH